MNLNFQYAYRLKRGTWTDVFDTAFIKYCTNDILKGCKISFEGHKINPKPTIGNFLIADAKCARS